MKFQWAKAAAMLGDYKEFIRTWGEAVDSTGFTSDQIGMQMDTISRKLATLKADLDGVFNNVGNAGLTAWIKDVVDSLDKFVLTLKHIPTEGWKTIGFVTKYGVMLYILKNALTSCRNAIAGYKLVQMGSAVATSAETAATIANTGAKGINVAATNSATAATGRLAVATTVASGGLNLILPLILGVGAAFYTYSGWVSSAEQAQRKKAQVVKDDIAIGNQELETIRQKIEFTDALVSSHIKIEQQMAGMKEGSEKYVQAQKNLEQTEVELTRVLGSEAVQRIKQSGWSKDAYDKEKKAFLDASEKKKQSLNELSKKRSDDLVAEQEILKQKIENYYKDADAYSDSLARKIKALGFYNAFQMKIAEMSVWSNQRAADNAQGNMNKLAQQMDEYTGGHSEAEYERMWNEYNLELTRRNNNLKMVQQAKDEAGILSESGIADAKQRLLDITNEINESARNMLSSINFQPTVAGGNDVSIDEDDKKRKGRKPNQSTPFEQESSQLNSIYTNYSANQLENFGETGCTAAVKKLLPESPFAQNANLWVPDWVQKAKDDNLWADASEGGRPGDIIVLETNSNTEDGADHVVVVVEDGNYVGNSSTKAKQGVPSMTKGNIAADYGAQNIVGYIRTGQSSGTQYNHFDTEKWEVNKGKMEQEKLFAASEIAAKRYESALSTVKAQEELYGKTSENLVDTLDLMLMRRKNLNDEEWLYAELSKQKQANLDNEISKNATVNAMLREQGVEWKNLTKEEQANLIDKSKLSKSQQSQIKMLNTLATQYKKKAEEMRKEKVQLDNEMLKSNFAGVFDPAKIYDRKIADIDYNEKMQKHELANKAYDPTMAERARQVEEIALLARKAAQEERIALLQKDLNLYREKGLGVLKNELDLRLKAAENAAKEAESAKRAADNDLEQKRSALAGASGADLAKAENDVQKAVEKSTVVNAEYAKALNMVALAKQWVVAADRGDTAMMQELENSIKSMNVNLNETNEKLEQAKDKFASVREKGASVFQDLIVQGTSFKDVWGKLWQELANDAIKALFRVQNNSHGLLSSLLGVFGGGGGVSVTQLASGRMQMTGSGLGFLNHYGGEIMPNPKMHDGGRVMLKPSLKDDEVTRTLQIGERVLSKDDNKRFESVMPKLKEIGGQGINVAPSFNSQIIDQTKATMADMAQTKGQISEIKKTNELLASMMAKMSSNSNSGVTVVSTKMSDEQILAVIARNPGALQSIMGRNRNMGYR